MSSSSPALSPTPAPHQTPPPAPKRSASLASRRGQPIPASPILRASASPFGSPILRSTPAFLISAPSDAFEQLQPAAPGLGPLNPPRKARPSLDGVAGAAGGGGGGGGGGVKRRASLAHFGGAAGGAEEGWGREWRGFSGVKGESEGAGRRASAPTKPNGEVREVKVKDRERAGVKALGRKNSLLRRGSVATSALASASAAVADGVGLVDGSAGEEVEMLA